ncbi:MAG: tetratricopeptide repeat protein [Longimicrobiales bacterium]
MNQRPEAEPSEQRSAPPGDAGARTPRRLAMSGRDEEILRSLAARIDPEDAGAHNNLGVVFYQKGLIEDAIRAFERALELDPRLDVARANVEVAYLDSGHFDRRVESLRERIRHDPTDVEARDALARTFLLGGRADEAARAWAALLKDRPDSTALHMKLAYAETERGRLDRAVQLIDRALERESDLAGLHLQRAEILHQAGRDQPAEAAARRSLELDPDSARAHLLLAELLETAGRTEAAEAARAQAERLDPGVVRGEQHLSLERYLSARDVRARREQQPEAVEGSLGRLARATSLRQAGDLDGAAAELEHALAEDDAFEARQALAEVRLLQGDPGSAAELYGELLDEEEGSPKLWNERGVSLHRVGRLDDAVSAYRHAVAMDYAYALGWNNLGVARAQLGEDGPAERALRKAVEDSPAPEILWNLGLFLTLTGEVEEAVEVYAAAVHEDGAVAESWSRLGIALFQADRPGEARDALERALEQDPELAEARYQLGFVLSALGDFKGALRETKRALAEESVFPAPRYRLLVDVQFEEGSLPAPDADRPERVATGQAIESFEFETGALDEAFDAFGDPEPPDAAEVAATLLEAEKALRRGQLRRAADRAARAVALVPGAPRPRLLQARVYLEQGLAGEALERYTEVLEHGPAEHAAEAAEGRVRSLLVLRRSREAVPVAEVAVELGAPVALLGRALLQAGDAESAVEVFEQAAAAGDASPETLKAHGEALLAAGRPGDAEPRFRRALESAPGAAARVGLARTLQALGDRAAAEQEFAGAVRTLPSYGPAALGLARLQWQSGRRGEALRTLVAFLELDPDHVDGLVRLGTWLYETGRGDQAVRALERARGLDPSHAQAGRELARLRREG